VQNFRTIGQGVFVGWVPENGMFPYESEVVLNTVLSANALHVIPKKETDSWEHHQKIIFFFQATGIVKKKILSRKSITQ
jgi:hypothetical protein